MIDVWVQRPEKVSLTDDQVRDLTREKLRSMLGGDGIEDRCGVRWVFNWHDTGHGSGLTSYLRVATELDEALVKVWAALG